MQVANIQKKYFCLFKPEKLKKNPEKPEKLSFYELCRFLTVLLKWKTFN